MEERELLTFLFSVTVLLIALLQHQKLYLFPALKLPFVAFGLLTLSNLANLLDEGDYQVLFNALEHILYVLSSAVIAYWLLLLRRKKSQ